MRLEKSILLLTISGLILTYLTLYTATAHNVVSYVYESDGIAVWRSAPSGSFFPWPNGSGMLQVLSNMNGTDAFIYTHLIKNWALIGATVLLWAAWLLYLLRLFRRLHGPK